MKRKIISIVGVALIAVGGLVYLAPWEQAAAEPVAVQQSETLDDCLRFMQYLSFGAGSELDALLEEKLQNMDRLLQSGARPTEQTRDLLPMDCQLRGRVTEILEKHGIQILAGENPDNPCCVPF